MKRQIAISDLHGCNRSFLALLDRLAFSKSDELFLLGDYVDRGPDSKGVIDTIWRLQAEGYHLKCLAGNHEEMTLSDLDAERFKNFKGVGDETLLSSFGVEKLTEIPEKYFDWMQKLPLFIEMPGYILVHAGLNFRSDNPFSDPMILLWTRNWYHEINYDWLGERVIVHGHTPMLAASIQLQLLQLPQLRVLDIDAGCATIGPSAGRLCAFDLTNRALHFQANLDF